MLRNVDRTRSAPPSPLAPLSPEAYRARQIRLRRRFPAPPRHRARRRVARRPVHRDAGGRAGVPGQDRQEVRGIGRVVAEVAAPARGGAQRPDLPAGRRRLRPDRRLRRPDRDAEHRPPGDERPALQQLPHHRPLLAVARDADGRTQPALDRPRQPRADGDGLPRLQRDRAAESAKSVANYLQAAGLRELRPRQVGPHAPLRGLPGRPLRPLAERRGLRPRLHLHGGRRAPTSSR